MRWGEQEAKNTVGEGVLDPIDPLIARVAGLRRRWTRLGAEAAIVERLRAIVGLLEDGRSHLALAEVHENDAARPMSVRDRVLDALKTCRRPVELVDELGLDPANVSRAIRELRDQRLIVEVRFKMATSEGRRIWPRTLWCPKSTRPPTNLRSLVEANASTEPTHGVVEAHKVVVSRDDWDHDGFVFASLEELGHVLVVPLIHR